MVSLGDIALGCLRKRSTWMCGDHNRKLSGASLKVLASFLIGYIAIDFFKETLKPDLGQEETIG